MWGALCSGRRRSMLEECAKVRGLLGYTEIPPSIEHREQSDCCCSVLCHHVTRLACVPHHFAPSGTAIYRRYISAILAADRFRHCSLSSDPGKEIPWQVAHQVVSPLRKSPLHRGPWSDALLLDMRQPDRPGLGLQPGPDLHRGPDLRPGPYLRLGRDLRPGLPRLVVQAVPAVPALPLGLRHTRR
jgi:hypothetical protein